MKEHYSNPRSVVSAIIRSATGIALLLSATKAPSMPQTSRRASTSSK